jgi:hypothetical protein
MKATNKYTYLYIYIYIYEGHKQKGAGTIMTGKAPIVTSDGIILKSHERLPSQLLTEFCQKEKRPTPKYFPEPPGHRYNVKYCHFNQFVLFLIYILYFELIYFIFFID